MIALSKIYSRERPLFDFNSWDECDRSGVKKYLNEKLMGGIFVAPPRGEKGEVWYSEPELERVSRVAIEKAGDLKLITAIIDTAEKAWEKIKPYVKGKRLSSVEEMLEYEEQIVSLWTAMNTVFFELSNYPELNKDFGKKILRFRKKTQDYTDLMMGKFVEYVQEFFPELGDCAYHIVPKDVVFYINSKEKSQLLKDFKKRAEKGCFVSEGKIFDIDGLKSELKRRNMFFKSADSEHANEVAGKSAFPGKAKGKARIIKTKKDLDKVKGGDIIVASMTNPDFTLHLKKSGAFVTDEGGLMCHAAIIAREMKKPCIVGTKTATEILKDGDLVEVDADKGVVKILKRAE